MDINNVYWYNFTSGSYDSYSYCVAYYSTEYIEQEVWEDHLNEYNTKKAALYAAIPLKEVPGYRNIHPRKVLDFDTPEAKAYNEFLQRSDPRTEFIVKHGLVQLDIHRDFHDSSM